MNQQKKAVGTIHFNGTTTTRSLSYCRCKLTDSKALRQLVEKENRKENDENRQNRMQTDLPLNLPSIQYVQDLEDDQLEHRARQCEHHREDQLDLTLSDLVRLEESVDEEDPTESSKQTLRNDDDRRIEHCSCIFGHRRNEKNRVSNAQNIFVWLPDSEPSTRLSLPTGRSRMLSFSQSRYETDGIVRKNELEISEVLDFFCRSNDDFRFVFFKNNSVVFGRDVFGRKSLCGRVIAEKTIEIDVGIPHPDSFEWPCGLICQLDNVENFEVNGQTVRFDFSAVETPKLFTFYPMVEHPFFSKFSQQEITQLPSDVYLKPSLNFDLIPTSEKIELKARELINRLSTAVRSVFTPNLLIPLDQQGPPKQLSICFSGGIDSLAVTISAAESLPDVRQFNLVNTSFGEDENQCNSGADRRKALECFEFLTKKYGAYRFSLILVNVNREQVAAEKPRVRELMRPKSTILDESLATVLFFGSRANGRQVFADGHQGLKFCPSNCALVGSGADELLGGYSRHRTAFQTGGFDQLHKELQMEIGRIGDRNFGRDDRIAHSNGVHLLAPFMSNDFVSWMNTVPLPYRVDFSEPRGHGEKRLLRVALRLLELPSNLTDTQKRAMQFGSNFAKMENRGMKGTDLVC
ncbi:Asparagine synthase [Aphelenchoides besseyi]|nr:Asparagine synthase [Aphelenchoides besseyi]